MKKISLVLALAMSLLASNAQATTITDLFNTILTDFSTFDTLEQQYLQSYPATGRYFQGLRSPEVVPIDGIPVKFITVKASDKTEGWLEFGFTGDKDGMVLAQYRIDEWKGPAGIGYGKTAQFGWEGIYYEMYDAMMTVGAINEKAVYQIGTYEYILPTLFSTNDVPDGYSYKISVAPVPEPPPWILLLSGLVVLVGIGAYESKTKEQ